MATVASGAEGMVYYPSKTTKLQGSSVATEQKQATKEIRELGRAGDAAGVRLPSGR